MRLKVIMRGAIDTYHTGWHRIMRFFPLLIITSFSCHDDNMNKTMMRETIHPALIVMQLMPHETINEYPRPGNEGIITAGYISMNKIQLIWQKAVDDLTPQEHLEYRVYQSCENNISTPASADANGAIILDWKQNASAVTATGLTPATTYYFNVIVRDADDNRTAYHTIAATTASDALYLFNAGSHTGKLTSMVSASPRADIDAICENARMETYPHLPCGTVRAFISISASDDIEDMASNYGIPLDKRIVSPSGVAIASNWLDLLDGSIIETLNHADIAPHEWWSGSDEHGKYLPVSPCVGCNTCSGWTSENPSLTGMTGAHNKTDSAWMSDQLRRCDKQYFLLCACW